MGKVSNAEILGMLGNRYGLVNRPAGLGCVPKGLMFEVMERPAKGQPHHEMCRHGVLVAERALTEDEAYSFELAPLVEGTGTELVAKRVAEESMGRYAAEYLAVMAEEPSHFRAHVLEKASDSLGRVRVSLGEPERLVELVASRLRELAAAKACA